MGNDHITDTPRIDYQRVFPGGVRAMVGLQHAVDGADLEPLLLELVKMRASQINGWNRLAISMRTPVGSYVSLHHQKGT
jgi:alkylhydroperoxidase family enzyme